MNKKFDNLNLLETIQHGVFVFDPELKLVSHNQAGVKMMGIPDELMAVGTSIEEHFLFNAERGEYGEGDVSDLVEQRMQPLRDGKPFDYQIERPNGKVIWRHGMFNEDGWLVVTFTDVTIRAREEDFLRNQNSSLSKLNQTQEAEIQEASENLERQNHILDTILSNISDGVSLVGRDLKLKMANNQLFDLLDLPKELNQVGLSVRKIYELKSELGELGKTEEENDVDNFISELFNEQESVTQYELSSGRSIRISRKFIEDGLVTTIADVTDLKVNQKQLEAKNLAIGERIEHQAAELSEQRKLADRLHAAIDASDTSILLFDEQYRFVFANKRFREVNPEGARNITPGMTYEDFLLFNLRLGVYPEIKEPFEDYVASRKEHLLHHTSNTIVEKTKFGTWLQIHEHRLPDGSLLSMANDITKLREMQIELETNEARFRDFASDGADWFWEMDETLTFSYVNGKINEVLGLTADEMIGKTRHEVHGYSSITAQGTWNSYLDTLEDEIHFVSPPVTIVRPDGETRYIITSGKPIYSADGSFKGYRGVGRDITELTRTEEALRRSQKMEAVGQLSGGIAHDFNNILGIIFGNLELLAEGLTDGSSEKKFAENALKGAGRAAELTHKLLGFSRHHHGSIDHAEVNELVQNMSHLISKSLTGSITVELDLEEDLHPVAINVGDFEDALLNLSLNARDAMPNGGKLFIETKNITISASDLKVFPEAKLGNYVVVQVQDTGSGMSKAVRERVFEPFFTTKDVGKGTGLGLSMVFGFVKRSGGFIELHSEPAMGTTFKIFLPEDTGEKLELKSAQIEKSDGKGQGERILLVDDEEDLLHVTKQVLEANGYSVVTTQNTHDALSLLKGNEKFDLLFSDVILAEDMDGFGLAKSARKIDPDLHILLTSGYSEKAEEPERNSENSSLKKADMILRKPYTQTELISIIREVLGNS